MSNRFLYSVVQTIWEVRCFFYTSEKVLYLTFDDGPHPNISPWLLSELTKHKVKSTFFYLGRNVKKYPELVQHTSTQNHLIGSHGYSHLNGWKTPLREYIANVKKCQTVFQNNLFRPPYGKLNLGQYKALKKHFKIYLWDVMAYDFNEEKSPEHLYSKMCTKIKPGSIIVFHENDKSEKNLRFMLPRLLNEYTKKGYRFDTL